MNDAINAGTLERVFTDICDELGCAYDNEAALEAIARLKAPKATVEREAIAETIWRAELRRATGRERNIPWSEVSDKDRERYAYIADAILARLDEAAIRADEREKCAKIADGWLGTFGNYKPEHVGAQTWANDAVKDIASAIRGGNQP